MGMQRTALAVCVGIVLGAAVSAQGPGPGRGGRGGAGQAVEKVRLLKPRLYLITGGGANTLVRSTEQGLIVVDTKNPGDEIFTRLMEEIRSASSADVRYVINTQHHPDHVGNNQKFLDMGAEIVAHEALAAHMGSDPRTKAIRGRPTRTFSGEHVVKLGDAEARLYFFGPGHSGGDTMVYFPDAKVVMVSDHITDGTPIVDFANGGSAVQWTRALDGVLALDFELAVPGRGEPKTRLEVQNFRDRFATLIDRAAGAIKAGATREDLATRVRLDDLGWQFTPQFFAQLYDELRQGSAGAR
jgi:glyoxylase-like metal-dependent hydrolase (beta-lactamase superfamily II)